MPWEIFLREKCFILFFCLSVSLSEELIFLRRCHMATHFKFLFPILSFVPFPLLFRLFSFCYSFFLSSSFTFVYFSLFLFILTYLIYSFSILPILFYSFSFLCSSIFLNSLSPFPFHFTFLLYFFFSSFQLLVTLPSSFYSSPFLFISFFYFASFSYLPFLCFFHLLFILFFLFFVSLLLRFLILFIFPSLPCSPSFPFSIPSLFFLVSPFLRFQHLFTLFSSISGENLLSIF